MNNRKFERVNGYEGPLPKRATKGSAGYDIAVSETHKVQPHSICVFHTGIRVKMNSDDYVEVIARSSLPEKFDMVIPNAVGIIDSDYYGNPKNGGEIRVPLFNIGNKPVTMVAGTRVAQCIFNKYKTTNDDDATGERVGGFGSTGVKQ
mgnify:CR=1 FL=1